jgi:DNA helicase-2/ATP-dependent DNA helicase PcrA
MSFLDQLNPVQRDAVEAVDGPVMIVAGAGSGKTRVLTYRTAYLIHKGVRPDSILALTFTNKAAEEMKGRITELVGEESRHVWMGTFHSLFARILRKECEHLGYQRNFSIYDTDDSLAAIKGIMSSVGLATQQYPPQGIRSRISIAKNGMISPKEYRQNSTDPATEATAVVYAAYEQHLKRANAMDFDDLLLRPLELFARFPAVLQNYQYRFSHILVDEYQDTNRVQYRLIRELARVHSNICVVGDDAQSIYAFRGADIRNILDFQRDYTSCKVFRLEQNYRSTKTILAAADSLIRHNQDQIPKKLWTDHEDGDPVMLEACRDDRDEGYRIATAIEDETRRGKRDLKDFVVLYRTNAQSRAIEDALRRGGIPYTIVGGVAFYKRKEIKDLLSYLRLIANPLDTESLLRIVNVPARAIGDTTVEKLAALAKKQKKSILDVMDSPHLEDILTGRAAKAVKGFHDLVRKYVFLKSQVSAGELAHALVDDLGILRILKEENTPDSLARRENIQELVSAVTEYTDQHPGTGIEDFLEEVSLVSDVDTADFTRNAVTLMTLHAAKGLEFPVVFIAGLEEGLFPLSMATESRKELEEERRLMYVGITRAQQRLYLCYASSRYRFGELSLCTRSRFLDEIDESLIARGNGREAPVEHRRAPAPRPRHPADDVAHYFADTAPRYEDESQEPLTARVGARVVHESFGAGRVVAVEGRGDDARAVVDFESVGRKLLLLKFAHLRAR